MTAISTFLIRYRHVTEQVGFAIYCFLVAIQYLLLDRSSPIGGLLNLALLFWYLGQIPDYLHKRYAAEFDAEAANTTVEDMQAQGYQVTLKDIMVESYMFRLTPQKRELIPSGIYWTLGLLIAAFNWPTEPLCALAGAIMATTGLIGFYTYRQPDTLLKSGNPS